MSSTFVSYWMSEPILHKAVNDLVHAAYRLEKRRLPFVFKRLVETEAPVLGTEQLLQFSVGPGSQGSCTVISQPSRVEPEY
jgi:hypothetical protein